VMLLIPSNSALSKITSILGFFLLCLAFKRVQSHIAETKEYNCVVCDGIYQSKRGAISQALITIILSILMCVMITNLRSTFVYCFMPVLFHYCTIYLYTMMEHKKMAKTYMLYKTAIAYSQSLHDIEKQQDNTTTDENLDNAPSTQPHAQDDVETNCDDTVETNTNAIAETNTDVIADTNTADVIAETNTDAAETNDNTETNTNVIVETNADDAETNNDTDADTNNNNPMKLEHVLPVCMPSVCIFVSF